MQLGTTHQWYMALTLLRLFHLPLLRTQQCRARARSQSRVTKTRSSRLGRRVTLGARRATRQESRYHSLIMSLKRHFKTLLRHPRSMVRAAPALSALRRWKRRTVRLRLTATGRHTQKRFVWLSDRNIRSTVALLRAAVALVAALLQSLCSSSRMLRLQHHLQLGES